MSRKHGADNDSGEREQRVGGGGLKDVRRGTQLRMWEYEQTSAAQMFSDTDQFAMLAAFSHGLLGQAQAQLGRAEGIGPDSPANSRSARNRRTRGQPLYARSS